MTRKTLQLFVMAILLWGAHCDGFASELRAEIMDCETATPATQVTLIDYGFDPPEVTVDAGSVVRWKNMGDVSHIVMSGAPEANPGAVFDTSFITVRNTKCVRFLEPGTYTYFCRIHAKIMRDGRIVVK